MNSPNTQTIKRIVVVGRDAAFWLTLNTLREWSVRTGGEIIGVELPSHLRPSDVYASLPQLRQLHARLGIEEDDLVSVTGGSYALGQSLVNFAGPDITYFHPYGDTGTPAQGEPFHLAWLRARQAGLKAVFSDFSLNAEIAQQARFFGRAERLKRQPRRVYGFHLPAIAYVSYLKSICRLTGQQIVQARTIHADVAVDGRISRVVPDSREAIEGDLFVDTTGSESLLLGDGLSDPFASWVRYFPSTQSVSLGLGPLKTLAAYAQVRAFAAGVLHLTPVSGGTGAQIVFHKDLTNFENAAHFALVMTGLPQTETVVGSEFEAGLRAAPWKQNVVAIGEAAAVLDPMGSTGLYVIQAGLARLMGALMGALMAPTPAADVRAAFNAGMTDECEAIRDFQLAAFKSNALFESGLWDYWRDLEGPDSLEKRIDTFRQSGQIHPPKAGPFGVSDWAGLFAGQRIAPMRLSESQGVLRGDSLKSFIAYELNAVRREAGQMNTLDSELAQLQSAPVNDKILQG